MGPFSKTIITIIVTFIIVLALGVAETCATTTKTSAFIGGVGGISKEHQFTGYDTKQVCHQFEHNACHACPRANRLGQTQGFVCVNNGQVSRLSAAVARAVIYLASLIFGGQRGVMVTGALDIAGALPTSVAASPRSGPGPVCSNADGIPGVESLDGRACCLASCDQCGGWGSSAMGHASDCCVSLIVEDGEACSDTKEAPCFVDDGAEDKPGVLSGWPQTCSEWMFVAFKCLKELIFYVSVVRSLRSFYFFMRAFSETRRLRRLARAAQNPANPANQPASLATSASAAMNAIAGMMRSVVGAS